MQSIKLYNPFLVSDQELHATIVIPVYLFGMCMDFIFNIVTGNLNLLFL